MFGMAYSKMIPGVSSRARVYNMGVPHKPLQEIVVQKFVKKIDARFIHVCQIKDFPAYQSLAR